MLPMDYVIFEFRSQQLCNVEHCTCTMMNDVVSKES